MDRLVPRRCSQGQEEVDPVVEMSRQPKSSKVLHHHGQQVLCGERAGEGRQAVDKRASNLSGAWTFCIGSLYSNDIQNGGWNTFALVDVS